jgi:hypothetical protein
VTCRKRRGRRHRRRRAEGRKARAAQWRAGHDIDYCQRIIDTYLPRTRKLAAAAIEKLEGKR